MEGKKLVIVESPHKADTIQNYVDKNAWVVKASVGHIRDLEEHKLSVDVKNGFKPEYVVPADKKKIVADLKKLAEGASEIYLASDADREGEAIAWHLKETLGLPEQKTRRITYQEITKKAFLEALEAPRSIDMNLVNAQQARRVMDRLVGFELSPILWKKIQPKLSAGRVQSVALRLIVDREKEIMAFVPEQYYRVEAQFRPEGSTAVVKAALDARFGTLDGARAFLQDSIGAHYRVASVEKKEGSRMPAPPFTTSTLQQEAARKLRFPVSTTMRVAQSLYEKGLITYMRTDSTNLSGLALAAAKKYITETYGAKYSHSRQFKTRSKGAQEAHEAIRPTFLDRISVEETPQEKKLYELIWKRTIASQMSDSKVLNTGIKISIDKRPEQYGAQSVEIIFDGFMKVYMESRDDTDAAISEDVFLPEVKTGTEMLAGSISANCKFTVPPARYSEATLVKKLEELEIGRPSTYQSIIGTLITGRGYVARGDKEGSSYKVTNLSLNGSTIRTSQKTETVGAEKGKLLPQEIGVIVSDYLIGHFADIMDYAFTANVENQFDEVAEGKKDWVETISLFYKPFHTHVEEVMEDRNFNKVSREIGIAPDGEKVIAAFGKFGAYVQKGEGDNRQSASLAKGQLIQTLTMAEALKLLELPRTVGSLDGVDIVAMRGRFGPYLKYGDKNVSLPKGADPTRISLEDCISIVKEASSEKQGPEIIAEFGDIKLINGRFGPYLKQGDSNFKLPRGTDASKLTEADCRAIIGNSEPTKNKRGGRRK